MRTVPTSAHAGAQILRLYRSMALGAARSFGLEGRRGADAELSDDDIAKADVDEVLGRVLVGPSGWLDLWTAGDLVGFRSDGDDVTIELAGEPATPDGLAGGLQAAFDRLNEGDGMPIRVAELVNHALGDLPEAPVRAAVLPPVGDLLPDNGFEIRNGFVGPEGTDWDKFERVSAAAVVDVRERLGSSQLAVGDLLCPHVVADGETHQLVGGVIPLPLNLRDQLVAALDGRGPAVELARRIGAAFSSVEETGGDEASGPILPTAAGALADFMREREDRWMDESVPALGGLTPREAAGDPLGRGQLEDLLDLFDRQGTPPSAVTFDTARLRAALGVEPQQVLQPRATRPPALGDGMGMVL